MPQAAILVDQAGSYVLVVDGSKVEQRRIRLGRAAGRRIVVAEGLQGRREGDRRGPAEGAAGPDGAAPPPPAKPAGAGAMISGVFVDRPRLAFVISIVITLAGLIAIAAIPRRAVPRHRAAAGAGVRRPIPAPAPTSSSRRSRSRSSSRSTASTSMLYMQSTAGSDGSYTLTVTFDLGTDPDINTVNVQNRANLAQPQLPAGGHPPGPDDQEGVLGPAAGDQPLLARAAPTTRSICRTTPPSTCSTCCKRINGRRRRDAVRRRSTIRCGSGSTRRS